MKNTPNIALYGVKIVTLTAYELLFFPLWWYTKGFYGVYMKLRDFLVVEQKSLGLWVWIKNIHKPMYGQYDWAGILISVIVRIFQIIIRSIMMVFWVLVALFLISLWIVLPPLVIFEVIFQLSQI